MLGVSGRLKSSIWLLSRMPGQERRKGIDAPKWTWGRQQMGVWWCRRKQQEEGRHTEKWNMENHVVLAGYAGNDGRGGAFAAYADDGGRGSCTKSCAEHAACKPYVWGGGEKQHKSGIKWTRDSWKVNLGGHQTRWTADELDSRQPLRHAHTYSHTHSHTRSRQRMVNTRRGGRQTAAKANARSRQQMVNTRRGGHQTAAQTHMEQTARVWTRSCFSSMCANSFTRNKHTHP